MTIAEPDRRAAPCSEATMRHTSSTRQRQGKEQQRRSERDNSGLTTLQSIRKKAQG